jgi:DNA polymerase iota
MDVSDIVEYNASISAKNVSNSFFCLSKVDPTVGFAFDTTKLAGNVYPADTFGKFQT